MILDTTSSVTVVNYYAFEGTQCLKDFTFGPGVSLLINNVRATGIYAGGVECLIISQSGFAAIPATLKPIFLFTKDSGPFGKSEKVEQRSDEGSLVLIKNSGLIGMDFVVSNKLKIVLDGSAKRIAVLR